MRRIISALLLSFAATVASGQGVAEPKVPKAQLELADGAPERHVVVPGDTLWDIAGKFLKTPYRWGDLWQLNAEDIKNPHWIYPGQVLVLDRTGSQPQLKLATVKEQRREYVEFLKKPISSIPPDAIEPFLSEPRVLDESGLESSPRVVAIQDGRVIAGAGDTIYTTEPNSAEAGQKVWQVFRPGKPLKDPETKEVLGYEAYYIGTARITRQGEPTSFLILTAREEIAAGDRLMPAPPKDVVSYIPRAPGTDIKARVLAIYGGVNFSGPQSVVTLNRGKADGLEPGHVLLTDLEGSKVDDRYKGKKTSYQLPTLGNGALFVFRVFDRVSYALVMSGVKPVVVGDVAHTP